MGLLAFIPGECKFTFNFFIRRDEKKGINQIGNRILGSFCFFTALVANTICVLLIAPCCLLISLQHKVSLEDAAAFLTGH